MLNKAIAAVEDENDALNGVLKNNIDFNAVKGKTKIPDQKWKDLLDHFNQPQFVLVNDNFEFPDLLGAAYEYLIKFFADSAGKKGGEFYTPAEVVRLLVQLVKPHAGNEIYDPTVGSGGFLIQSHQYVEEQGQNPNDLALYGQDSNGTVWSICIMNMILHNITRFTIENGDTLEDPQTLDHGQIRRFDRVLANPPFSQNYSRATLKFSSRFREWCPETGKKKACFQPKPTRLPQISVAGFRRPWRCRPTRHWRATGLFRNIRHTTARSTSPCRRNLRKRRTNYGRRIHFGN